MNGFNARPHCGLDKKSISTFSYSILIFKRGPVDKSKSSRPILDESRPLVE